MPLSYRPTYSLPSLKTYLSHISLPAAQSDKILQNVSRNASARDWASSSSALQTLQVLQKYQQAKIPFSNLYLHYSRHHVGTLDPRALFEYLVQSRGIACEGAAKPESGDPDIMNPTLSLASDEDSDCERTRKWKGRPASGGRGGTCTVNNTFFATVMRSFGMDVMSTGARVALPVLGGPKARFFGWNHLINLVGFEGRRYLVDVGFGGTGPTTPIELVDGNELPWGSTNDRIRLIYTSIPEFTFPSSRCWILQHRQAGNTAWDDTYCFTETEFLPQDIAVMNFKTTRDVRGSFFNHVLFCGKNLLEDGEVVGIVNLTGGRLKRTVGGEETLVQEVGSEVERWEVLEKEFGIVLGDEERMGIRGLVTELRGKPKKD
ncbi:cysteine proteinase [Cadophora sp. DSE1049]|nr:cysteine proteinase [Cadophora sp. DSE1049]